MLFKSIIIISLLSSNLLLAQEFGITNQKDSLGRRIGYWEYEMDYFTDKKNETQKAKLKGHYSLNQKEGTWSIYDFNNKIYEQKIYHHGKLIAVVDYKKGRISTLTSYKETSTTNNYGQILIVGIPFKTTIFNKRGKITDILIFNENGEQKSIMIN